MAQLEMTNQAITNVETTTCQIENMLKDLGLSHQQQQQQPNNNEKTRDILVHAEQSLDSAIKSASHIYTQQKQLDRRPSSSVGSGKSDPPLSHRNSSRFTTRIKYKPDTKHLLRQLNDKLRELELDAGKFFESMGTTNDVNALQKAYVDLDLAKTVALSAKSNLKRRKILLTSSRRRNDVQVKVLGEKIREGVDMWKTYTRDAPLMVNGEDILVILDLQDNLLDRNPSYNSSRMSIDIKSRGNSPTNSSSSTTTTSASHRPSWRQSLSNRNRSPSISDNSSIPLPTTPTLIPLNSTSINTASPSSTITNTSNTNSMKRPVNRHSSSVVTSRVKANIGVGTRVRTASITNKNKENQQLQPQQKSSHASNTSTTTATPISSNINSHTNGTKTPPTLGSQLPPLPTSSSLQNEKPSLIKPPTQRGPGSTLRIRSMLAKRNNQQSSTKPNTTNDI
ncbi:unnamed protein product [Cunninghamella echinulata]